MPSKFHLGYFVIWTAALICLNTCAPAPKRTSVWQAFLSDLKNKDCKFLDFIVFPKEMYIVEDETTNSIRKAHYNLSVPLKVCVNVTDNILKTPEFSLCSEIFEVLRDLSTCNGDFKAILERKALLGKINISMEVDDVCKQFSANRNVFVTKTESISYTLANENNICPFVCKEEDVIKACSFLLWGRRVQSALHENLDEAATSRNPALKEENGSPKVDTHIKTSENLDQDQTAVGPTSIHVKPKKLPESALKPTSESSKANAGKAAEDKMNDDKPSSTDSKTSNSFKTTAQEKLHSRKFTTTLVSTTDSADKQKTQAPDGNKAVTKSLKSSVTDQGGSDKSPGGAGSESAPGKPHTTVAKKIEQLVTKEPKHSGSNNSGHPGTSGGQLGSDDDGHPVPNEGQQLSTNDDGESATNKGEQQRGTNDGGQSDAYEGDQPGPNDNGQSYTNESEQLVTKVAGQSDTNKSEPQSGTNDDGQSDMNDSEQQPNDGSQSDTNEPGIIDGGQSSNNEAGQQSGTNDGGQSGTYEGEQQTGTKNGEQRPGAKNGEKVGADKVTGTGNNGKTPNIPLPKDTENKIKVEEEYTGGSDGESLVPDPGQWDTGNSDDYEDPCKFQKCSGHGICKPVAEEDTFKCECSPDFEGTECEKEVKQESAHENNDAQIHNTDNAEVKFIKGVNGFPEQEDNHFFFYFITIVIFAIGGYVLFHNKQKIFALIIEGRHERKRRSGASYRKLETK